MTISASIDVNFADSQKKISAFKLLEALLTYGWVMRDHGLITYLPIGDNGDYSWQQEEDEQIILRILNEKEALNEVLGIALTWKQTNVGGSFLFWNEGNFSMNLNINRKTIDFNDQKLPDVNWYISRLLPAFYNADLIIESFSFCESI